MSELGVVGIITFVFGTLVGFAVGQIVGERQMPKDLRAEWGLRIARGIVQRAEQRLREAQPPPGGNAP